MNIKPLLINNAVGKHKIPRYIYHLTNKKSYNTMLKEGVLKSNYEAVLVMKCVFGVELVNFLKHWGKVKKDNEWSLQEQLVYDQASKGQSDMVILKISTKSLDNKKLFVRSQNKIFNFLDSLKEDDFIEIDQSIKAVGDTLWALKNISEDYLSVMRGKIFDLVKKFSNSEIAKHITEGVPAKESRKFERKAEAIEYFYTDDIPISNVEKIGEIQLNSQYFPKDCTALEKIKLIFIRLLKGTPEEKSAKSMKTIV